MRSRYRERHPFTGLIVGAISGLVGTVVMTQFQNVWNKISEDMQKPRSEHDSKAKKEQREDSTMKVAGKISEEIGHPLSREERKKAGPWVHYAFGTSVGAIFGVAREIQPDSVRGITPVVAGAAYGTTVFIAAHEVAVPALKLSSNPLKEPIRDQIAEFVSHLVYGISTALTYNGLKRLKQ